MNRVVVPSAGPAREDVLETVFRQVAGPLATPGTPGAWWRGLRLLALDGTQASPARRPAPPVAA
ncbi:hypothetical protein [Streptomyces atratus]|uniref:hypothetical protein n=1 Tax=Streptomyces atratus TaxID=1893 RepID=UPI0033FC12DD